MAKSKKDKTICLVGALDTKGDEFTFIKENIERRGFRTILVNTGVFESSVKNVEISNKEVAQAGGADLEALVNKKDRGGAISVMSNGAAEIVKTLYDKQRIDGILSMGGTAGTAVGTNAMRALPIGIPKVMVSTVASGDTSGYVGTKDILMLPSIVDVSGINRISREIFLNAVGAVTGMVSIEKTAPSSEKPLIAATMFGNTTPCVEKAKEILEEHGYEVLIFHATGTGGKTMEDLIEGGFIVGVLDITTTEWADELVGGVLNAGKSRLEAAARKGIPSVVVPGCLDMVNFWAPDTVPEKFKNRKFYPHNPNVTLMRTTPDEMKELGEIISEKLNMSTGPVEVYLPLKGLSMIDAPDGPFWWPDADNAFFESLRGSLRKDIKVIDMDVNINDESFALKITNTLLEMLK